MKYANLDGVRAKGGRVSDVESYCDGCDWGRVNPIANPNSARSAARRHVGLTGHHVQVLVTRKYTYADDERPVP